MLETVRTGGEDLSHTPLPAAFLRRHTASLRKSARRKMRKGIESADFGRGLQAMQRQPALGWSREKSICPSPDPKSRNMESGKQTERLEACGLPA